MKTPLRIHTVLMLSLLSLSGCDTVLGWLSGANVQEPRWHAAPGSVHKNTLEQDLADCQNQTRSNVGTPLGNCMYGRGYESY